MAMNQSKIPQRDYLNGDEKGKSERSLSLSPQRLSLSDRVTTFIYTESTPNRPPYFCLHQVPKDSPGVLLRAESRMESTPPRVRYVGQVRKSWVHI